MKNLVKKVKDTGIGLGLLAISALPSFGQDSTSTNNSIEVNANRYNVSIGTRSWTDSDTQEIFGSMFMIKGAYERILNGNLSLEISPEIGMAHDDYGGGVTRDLKFFELNAGLNKYYLLSEDGKMALYGKAGLKKIFGSDVLRWPDQNYGSWSTTDSRKEKINDLGYYLSGGLEIIRNGANPFVEVGYNETFGDYPFNNIQLSIGLKF